MHGAVHDGREGEGHGRRDLSCRLLATEYDPAEFKNLGRQIAPWSQETWEDAREAVVTRGNTLKFGQNAALGEVLLSTGDLVLAEAAENDRICGIGLNLNDAQAASPGVAST